MKIFIIFLVFISACSSEPDTSSEPDPSTTADMGFDSNVLLDVSTKDISSDDVSNETDTRPETCRQNSDCWRGEYCSDGRCNGVFGCKPATLPPSDLPIEPRGCWYEHDVDYPVTDANGGAFTAQECQTNDDCKNPDEPNCVVYVCHHNPSCSAGPCPAGTTCMERLDYCLDD